MCVCVFKIHFNRRESRRERERGVRGLDDEKRERDSGRQRGQTSAAPYRRTVRVRARVCVCWLTVTGCPLSTSKGNCVCVCTRVRVCVCVRVTPPGESSLENKCRSACVRVCCSNIRSWGRLKKRGRSQRRDKERTWGRGQRLRPT